MALTIFEGGMGQELVHDDFFAAGAEVATTNTYAVLPDRLAPHGLDDRLDALTRQACAIAAAARDAAGGGLVAGSLGPLGFSYRPDLAPPADRAAEVYARVAAVQAEGVDVLLLETMSSVDEARGGLMGALSTGKSVWLALSVDDTDGTRLRSGEPLADIAPLVATFRPDRVLLNCSRPEAVTAGLPVLAGLGCPFGACANWFTWIDPRFDRIGATTDLLVARDDIGPDRYADFAADWVAAGATTVGGCCEVTPAYIAALSRRLRPRTALPTAADAAP